MRRSRLSRSSRRAAVPAVRRIVASANGLPPTAASTPPLGPYLADKVPLILFGYDIVHRRLLHCNQHCHTVLGFSNQELLDLGTTLRSELIHPDSLTKLRGQNLDKKLALGRPLSWECQVRHRDGSWRWLRMRVRASAIGPDGHVREIMGSAEDVTRYRATLDELRHNRHLLRQVIDLAPNVIYIYDLHQNRTTYVNERVESLLGYSSAEMLAFESGSLLSTVMSAEVKGKFEAYMAEVAKLPDGKTRLMAYPVRHRNGTLRWLRTTTTPFARATDGTVYSIIGVAEDVTEQRAADEQSRAATLRLAEQYRLFRQVIDTLPHPIFLRDDHGNYQLANQATADLFGLSMDDLMQHGTANAPFANIPDRTSSHRQDQQVLATGQDSIREESHLDAQGLLAWFISVKRLFVDGNEVRHVLGISTNITELTNTQQALEAASATAKVNAQAKEDFLANMSHEIRTPLHGILGLTGVLAKTTLNRSQHDYLGLLGESAEHLLMVLNDVLTTARLGAGKLQPESIAFQPAKVLTGCAALLRPRAREKGLRLRVDMPDTLPEVLGDAHRLRQVLLNLVSNAIKFTATGQVQLRCQVGTAPVGHPVPTDTIWLQFTVSDTGVGIPSETLDKVFEPFAQAAASTDREYGGTGLGLSISDGLVTLMGGMLRVCSEVDQGSTFAFTLAFRPVPVALPGQAASPALTSPSPATGRILLVEDNLVNSLLAETVLRNWGWEVTTAASGQAAIKLFEFRPFDLVLMDIQMPGMDGETAARALREHSNPVQAATPIIALTARAQAGEAERLQAAGFAGYLAKPYREEQLLETMQAVLARQHRPTGPEPASNPFSAMPAPSPLYDLSNVRQLVRHDEAITRRLAWAFIETTPAILSALDEALTKANWEAAGDAAHHLKSSLDGLGVESLRLVIREVEAYGDSPPEPAQAAQQVALVRATTEKVMTALRSEFPEHQA